MGIKEFRPISKIFSGIFLLTSLNFCPGIGSVGLVADNNIQVALAGDTVYLHYQVAKTVNISSAMRCYSPSNSIIFEELNTKGYKSGTINLTHVNSSDSGSYRCELTTKAVNEKAYWFLHVRDKGFQMPRDDKMTIVGAFTAVLGISSVAFSLYLFKGHIPSLAKRSSRASKGEAKEGRAEHKDPAPQGAMATTPADVYASLEVQPGSIYHTLETSAAREDTGPGRAASSSSQRAKEETPRSDQNQDALECFYENF